MRNLTATLLAAQKAATHTPYLKVEAVNKIGGVVRLDWERLYSGTEDDYYHALTMPADGSLVRVRLALPADGRKLYRQRVVNPGPSSDFSSWTDTGQYNCVVAAAASLGAEVSILWINSNREIRRIKSSDYGASWGSSELIDYSPTTAIYGLAAAYKPNGDLAIFFADQSALHIKEYAGGSWQARVAWDKTTGDLSGVAVVYQADWNLLVTGKDSAGNYKLWSLVYGDGGDVSAGTWSALQEFASAPSGSDFEYHRVFLDKPDVYRCFYIEKFSGTQAYNRPFWSHSVAGTKFVDSLWREPVPFNLSSDYGLAIADQGDYCWLSAPDGVWRAGLNETSIDLTADVLSLEQESGQNQGKITVQLSNDDGGYSSLPSPLDIGCRLEVSPGYVTPAGGEVSPGTAFSLESFEHTSSGGRAALVLQALDVWAQVNTWRARHQFRWNKSFDEMSVKEMLAFVLARVGLKLEVISQSSLVTGYYPDFTIHPNNRGDTIIRSLLSFVPDVIFIEGSKAYLLNPLVTDSSAYSYGLAHSIQSASYRQGAWALSRVQVEGYDPVADEPIIVDSFAWSQLTKIDDRLASVEDRNIDTVAGAEQRGEAFLRESEIESTGGQVTVPVNCGQQLYDVIDITDNRAGLSAEKKRVLGLLLSYNPGRALYQQRLLLGAV